MAIPLESIIGSVLGWAVGVSDIPGLWTWIGGLITVFCLLVFCAAHFKHVQKVSYSLARMVQVSALIVCTYAQGHQKASIEKKHAVSKAMQDALGENGLVELSNTFAIVESSDEEDVDIDEL